MSLPLPVAKLANYEFASTRGKGGNEFAHISGKGVHLRVCLKLPLPAALCDNGLPLPRAMNAIVIFIS